jgi:CDP-diacylglycerol pyrophosphatase
LNKSAGNPVHDICVPDQRQFGSPSPCTKVDLADGYAILEDPSGPTHFLLIPTARVTGIEDPAIRAPNAPNYWAQAWQARQYVEQRAGRALGREEVSLAINSIAGRTQDQLHIHIDCTKPAVRAALHAHAAAIGPDWTPFPVPLAGERYLARRIGGPDLAGVNPFQLLAALPQARADMGKETLVITGETEPDRRPAFILLAGRAIPGTRDKGSGEDLQDHRCALARSPERSSG